MISEETSPSLLNLRDYRIQKKALLSHSPLPDGSLDSSSDLSFDFTRRKAACRKLRPLSESDSESDNLTYPNTVNMNGHFTVNSNSHKSELVKEKEQLMRLLKDKYPQLDSMSLHNILSKHNFIIDNAINEIQALFGDAVNLNQETDSTVESLKKRYFNAEHKEQIRKKGKYTKITAASDDSEDEDCNRFKDDRVFNSDEDSDVEISNELTKDKKEVLDYFENALLNELQIMRSCSKKKAEAIIAARPFHSWLGLVEKLQGNKNLGTDLLNAAQEVLSVRFNMQRLMNNCIRLSQELEIAMSKGAEVKAQPTLLDSSQKLTHYQMVGLNWLAALHAQGVNGILADEMGLGKTIQVIAFLAHLKEAKFTLGFPHLVIVPSSTLDNWRTEFRRWCPTFNVLVYYGSVEERRSYRIEYWVKSKLAEYDVILTTYSMVSNSPEERKMFKVTQMHYVIFDEAHMLKNMNTQRYTNLIRIKAKNRILVTGTPLQNNLLELMSLLIFVMPDMFAGRTEDLKSLFNKSGKANKHLREEDLPKFEKEQIKHAKDIMKPFLLRRLKKDVLQALPKKNEELIKVTLAPTQLEQYRNLVASFQNIGEATNNETFNSMAIMTDLRKLSNHPLLLRHQYRNKEIKKIANVLAADPSYKERNPQYISDDLLCMSDFEIHLLCKQYGSLRKFQLANNLILTSGKFLYLDKTLPDLKANGHRVLIFSQYVIVLNILEEYLRLRNHLFLRLDGSTPVIERQELIDQFTSDNNIFVFLLSTKAGGLGINLTAADTVIIHDIDFNPYNDKQAEDRCHRMGQLKTVNVYRLISQETIEEGMWQMNQEKLKLEQEVTAEESENPDVKNVVRLLSSALGLDCTKLSTLMTTS